MSFYVKEKIVSKHIINWQKIVARLKSYNNGVVNLDVK